MIGFIGGGKMAEALIRGLCAQGIKNIFASDISENRRVLLESTYGIKTTQDNTRVASECDILIMAVKPQNMPDVLDEIASSITEGKIVISIAAGLSLEFFGKKLKTQKIVRAMPNTPALVLEGMTALSFDKNFPEEHRSTVEKLFMSVGKVLILPEESMNAVSAVSGCGPAFIALFLEAIITAGTYIGLSPEHSAQATIQTCIGTAELLKTGLSPETWTAVEM